MRAIGRSWVRRDGLPVKCVRCAVGWSGQRSDRCWSCGANDRVEFGMLVRTDGDDDFVGATR